MDSRDTGTQHKLRMPPELKQKIQESAKEHNRSMNADIVSRLEYSFEKTYIEADILGAHLASEKQLRLNNQLLQEIRDLLANQIKSP